jgi:hypothetical protein
MSVFPPLSPLDLAVLNGFFFAIVVVAVDHAEKLHELPDEYLADALPIAKKIAVAQGAENYNILQVGTVLTVNPYPHPLRSGIYSIAFRPV